MGTFRFKQFEVVQDFSAMKVNTDAVLLGAWMSVPWLHGDIPLRLLDIGTGTGVIALMAGQRLAQAGSCGRVEAVEIDEGACRDAERNFEAAPWKGVEMVLHKCSLQELSSSNPDKFDLIFTNPPYFIDSLKSSDESKILARHTDTLSQREILFHSARLLKPGGTLALVLPVVEGDEFLRKVSFIAVHTPSGENRFTVKRVCRVHTVERKPAKRLLIELSFTDSIKEEPHIGQLVMMSGGSNTAQYAELVSGFYL
ncbi:MAG: methyltransferase [Bacteroidales bacterium]|nr:methyltransferase [Bacteroidales bacterium]